MIVFRKTILMLALGLIVGGCSKMVVRHDTLQGSTISSGTHTSEQKAAEDTSLDRRAYHHYVNGLLFEEIGDWVNASEAYRFALEYYPTSHEIGLAYAGALMRIRQPQRALASLNLTEPADAQVLSMRASINRQLGNDDAARDDYLALVAVDSSVERSFTFLAGYYHRHHDLDSTLWAYRHLEHILPGNHRVLNDHGRILRQAKRLEEAKAKFRQSLTARSGVDNMPALVSLSELYNEAGQPDSAISVFEVALDSSPDKVVLYKELARIWLQRDSTARALTYVRSVADLSPEDAVAQRQLAIVYFSLDSLSQADSILTALIASGDNEAANHYYLGRISLISEDFQRAKDEFAITTEMVPAERDGWQALAFACRRMGDTLGEIAAYQDGLPHMAQESDGVQLYFTLGAAFERAGMLDSAIATFEELLKHQDDHAPALNYLGYTLADLGRQLEYAKDLIERAIELQPNNAAFLDSYGWVYYRLGDFEMAVEHLSTAAELDSDPVIYDHLGDAYQAVGKEAKAREWWQKALDQQPDNETVREKLNR